MDENEVNGAEECCVGCLTKDEEKLSNADVSGLLKDFLNRELTHLFKHIPAVLCTECVTQMESHINFKVRVEKCIATLEKDLPAPPVKGRGRPKKADSEKKSVVLQNGSGEVKKGRGRPKKDGTATPASSKKLVYSENEDDEDASYVSSEEEAPVERRGRKRKNLVYDMDSSDSEEWAPEKISDKVERRGRPPKNGSAKLIKDPKPGTSGEGSKKRGRPKKTESDASSAKKRGRPKKIETNGETDPLATSAKKRGRPKKVLEEVDEPEDESESEHSEEKEEDETMEADVQTVE